MFRRSRIYRFFFLWLLCSGLHATAQLQAWRHINIDGVANKNIMCMTAGSDGMLYLGTQGGLEIFDGRRFMVAAIPGYVQKGINTYVNSMRWDEKGRLWINTRTHIVRYNPRAATFDVMYGERSPKPLYMMEVDTVAHKLYIFREDSALCFSIKETGVTYARGWAMHTSNETAVDAVGVVYAVAEGNSRVTRISGAKMEEVYRSAFIRDVKYMPGHGRIVMLTSAGLVTVDVRTGVVDTLPARPDWKHSHPKTRLSVLANDEILVKDPDGIHLVHDLSDTAAVHFSYDEKNPASIQTDYINCAFTDTHGSLWTVADGIGISVLPRNSRHIRYVSAKMTGAARLWQSWHDRAHNVVFTGSEAGICATYYKANRVYYQPAIKANDRQKFFESLFFTPWGKDELLLITNGQGSWRFNTVTHRSVVFDTLNRHFQNKSFWGGMQIDAHRYLLNSFRGSYLFDRATGKVSNVIDSGTSFPGHKGGKLEVISSKLDGEKNVWFGGYFGVVKLDSDLKFRKLWGQNENGRKDGIGNTTIMDMLPMPDGGLYLATMGGGVFRLTKADTFESVPLAGNVTNIYRVAQLDDRNLLITTNNGMCLYDMHTGTSKLASPAYGMPVDDFNQGALNLDSELVMGAGAKGIVIIDRDRVKDIFSDTASLLVMDGSKIIDHYTLEQGRKLLDFDVSVAGYAGAANWKIRYKLEGLDDDWRELAKGEWHIRYNSVTPGAYKLFVEAVDEQNVFYAAPVAISVTALPYFWQTTWFRILLALLCLGLLVFVVRFFSQLQLRMRLRKLENEQRVARERIRISRELHDNVGSQLTYLISGLESSDMLLEKKDTDKLKNKIGKMQSSARESMQQLRDSIWALNHESVPASVLLSRFSVWLEHIMEAVPGTKYSLHSELAVDHTLDPIKSLNLFRIMQEAVHNVVKHAGATQLSVTFGSKASVLHVVIEDNGSGFEMDGRAGNGRKTMASRAEEMGAVFSLVSAPGKGTRIVVEIVM